MCNLFLREFTETMASLAVTIEDGEFKARRSLQYNTKLSSAGLIYAFYGFDVIKEILKSAEETADDSTVEFYYDRLYKHFVESVDAVDNGIRSHDDPAK